MLNRICVFCGSSTGARSEYTSAAQALGREMATRGIGLVFGGGGVGLMGVIADAVLAAGGHAIGVIPHAMVARELAHRALPDLRIVNSMHERKATMAALADAFIAMPGGFGTFEEFFEVVTWTRLGLHRKACGLLNVSGYYDPLITQIDRGVAEGFVREGDRRSVFSHADPAALIGMVAERPEPPDAIWLSDPAES